MPFANLGAQDENSDGCDDLALVNKELSDEENKVDTNLISISDSLTPVPYNKKHKYHTPNPRKKGPAGANTSCYILGVSFPLPLTNAISDRYAVDRAVECQLLQKVSRLTSLSLAFPQKYSLFSTSISLFAVI